MKLHLRPTVGWVCAVLIAAFHAFALYGKFVPPEAGSMGDQFSQAVGMKGLETQLGILQLCVLVLFLIPRTMTIGFILMVGYMGGIVSAMLTHGFSHSDVSVIYISIVVLAISAWGRNPELLTRIMGKQVKA